MFVVGKNTLQSDLINVLTREEDDAIFMQQDVVDLVSNSQSWSFGVIGVCSDLVDKAWSKHDQRFKSSRNDVTPPPHHYLRLQIPGRLRRDFLAQNPVDCLIVEGEPTSKVIDWVTGVDFQHQPKAVVIMLRDSIMENLEGPLSKLERRKLGKCQYTIQYWHLNAFELGASLNQSRMAIVITRGDEAPMQPNKHAGSFRSMSNLLRCYSIPKALYLPGRVTPHEENVWPCTSHSRMNDEFVYESAGIMPDSPNCILNTAKGLRRLQIDELCKAKGLNSKHPHNMSDQVFKTLVKEATCQHIWLNVLDAVGTWLGGCGKRSPLTRTPGPAPEYPTDRADESAFDWSPPDLRKGSKWYNQRVRSLDLATRDRPDQKQLVKQGLKALDFHRKNYSAEGPKYLQLLWWEFPEDHWESLRCGSSMNFLIKPTGELKPNNFMEEEDKAIAGKFIDELKGLGALRKAEGELLANCPLFTLDKSWSKEEKRVIADMKGGGQNSCIGKDPVYLVQKLTILPQLYPGGYSAVADASKQFHNFPTRPEERKYLGCIHPITGEKLVWVGLPMGSANSPAIACRLTYSVLRQIREREPIFQGMAKQNTWMKKMDTGDYDARKGHGRVLIRRDGEPAALMWVMVDDFLIHAPSKEACEEAFRVFLNHMVRVGFICQVAKTKPPAQAQKFCGLIFNTERHPYITIPSEKLSRSKATIQFIKKLDKQGKLSRLSLSILGGLLQSLVEATPGRQGQTYLKNLYDNLHHTTPLYGRALYYTRVNLTSQTMQDLNWWEQSLISNVRNYSRTAHMENLSINWGDGSGTGMGGTSEFLDSQGSHIEAFMGVWKGHVHKFDSNWRELRTLLYSLEFLISKYPERLINTTLFYFTDNLVSYYVVHNGSSTSMRLHDLIYKIKMLEIIHQFRLEAIHVPGTLMIRQGADGLSRGIKLNANRMLHSTIIESTVALQASPFSFHLMNWVLQQLNWCPNTPWVHHSDTSPWTAQGILHTLSVWTPTPECARQAIDSFLTVWVESPMDSAGIFIIPRVLQRDWNYMSRHIQEFGVYDPTLLPNSCNYDSLIPFCILVCYPHVRRLPAPERMEQDSFTLPHEAWYKHQAEYVRGLQ